MGTKGVFYAVALAQVVAALISAYLFGKGKWKNIQV